MLHKFPAKDTISLYETSYWKVFFDVMAVIHLVSQCYIEMFLAINMNTWKDVIVTLHFNNFKQSIGFIVCYKSSGLEVRFLYESLSY